MKKSYIVQMLWAIIAGPLGLFYSSPAAGVVFLVIAVLLAVASGGLLLVFVWPVAIAAGFVTVHSYNEKAELEERRHQELVAAVKGGQAPTA